MERYIRNNIPVSHTLKLTRLFSLSALKDIEWEVEKSEELNTVAKKSHKHGWMDCSCSLLSNWESLYIYLQYSWSYYFEHCVERMGVGVSFLLFLLFNLHVEIFPFHSFFVFCTISTYTSGQSMHFGNQFIVHSVTWARRLYNYNRVWNRNSESESKFFTRKIIMLVTQKAIIL